MHNFIKLLLLISLILCSCALPWDIVKERKIMSKFHRRLIWEKGKDKRCNEEFVIKRINDENRFYYILAEQENCAVFISITADSEEIF